jgi:mRNA interferase RelE/StbE
VAYRVVWWPAARKQLAALGGEAQRRIVLAASGLAADPRPHGVKRLRVKTRDLWRIRVGDYRVIYEIRDVVLLVLVAKVGHRRDVYRGL